MNPHLFGFAAVALVLGALAVGHYFSCNCTLSRRGRRPRDVS